MASRVAGKIKLQSVDELLGVPEIAGTQEIEIGRIHAFPNHPFKVLDDEKMDTLVDSIRGNGILNPVIVRPDQSGNYEMISGHRRLHAAGIVGLQKIPAIVKEMSDNEAIIKMVDANIQREEILPSERAFSFKMKMEAMSRQGSRVDLTCGTEFHKSGDINKKTRETIGDEAGMTGRQVTKYIRLEVLIRYDTKSDPENVLELLEEYIAFRENKMFEKIIDSLRLKNYSTEFIKSYLENPSSLTKKECNKFKAALREEQLDLLYLDFFSKYQGKDDKFGIVIDRDCGSHSEKQMKSVVKKCKEKQYLCYITNPCIEFWQLLHVSDVASEYAEFLEDILWNETDDKKNTFVSNLLYEKTGERKAIQVCKFSYILI